MRLSFDFWLWVFNVMGTIYYVCWFIPSSPEWSQYCHDQWSFQCMNVSCVQTFLLRIFDFQYQTTVSLGIMDYSLFLLCLYLILYWSNTDFVKRIWICSSLYFLTSLRIVYRPSLKVWWNSALNPFVPKLLFGFKPLYYCFNILLGFLSVKVIDLFLV